MTASRALPAKTDRSRLLAELLQGGPYDLAIVGGGATGLGVALDAASRGLSVALVESLDFAKGTSSRATKLAHGGVRYLAQGNIALVREALRERRAILRNAPHLAAPLPFVVPGYRCWEAPFYTMGLKLYEALAGRARIGGAELLSPEETLRCLPGVRSQGLKGAARYWDGQFDDARLALALARTAASFGAVLLNYCSAERLLYENGRAAGLQCRDAETGESFAIRARCVVNATGVWTDELRRQDSRQRGQTAGDLVMPSQGVHLVVDASFLDSQSALLVPRTRDGRVLFAVPWLGKLVLGTTDTPRMDIAREPVAGHDEVEFILNEAGRYLSRAPVRSDVTSVWAGLRPLVVPGGKHDEGGTSHVNREHTVLVSASGLVSVAGGKWTTYRAMAQDVLARCEAAGLLPSLPPCRTENLMLVGGEARRAAASLAGARAYDVYGSEEEAVRALPGADAELCAGVTEAMLRFAARHEYARTVEDALARRCRTLFLDAAMAASIAPRAARIMREETGVDPRLEEFLALAEQYANAP
ncbi:MAG TPA: glycerol-3-phosphate dehydrogenase/oxidase [Eoetvoesiella sp.]|uniref:glycerol-3-phosphate dehydrogenase/oxidase n=1 Tax=Eoetvoesiella sp. TaxID=1966355 RepID=UPI002C808E6A|nr:glycerol-3-phosphate dehydrogenase/oxidase [Eoetvoesiella sp.]HWK61820.1 glycerol-3-phosphate dehydrogenase/oxidase [Eoetvoesiella sp.]